MIPLDTWRSYAVACVAARRSRPGPNLLYLVSRTLCQGRAAGFVSLAGTTSGFLVPCARRGVRPLRAARAVPVAYDACARAGAAYLSWLAWDAVRSHGSGGLFARRDLPRGGAGDAVSATACSRASSIPRSRCSSSRCFRSSSIPSRGSVLVQTLVLGATQIVIAVAGDSLFVLAAAGAARWLADASGVARGRSAGCWPACSARSPRSSRSIAPMTRANRAARASTSSSRWWRAIWGSTFIAGRIVSAEMSAPVGGVRALPDRDVALVVAAGHPERGLPRLTRAQWIGVHAAGRHRRRRLFNCASCTALQTVPASRGSLIMALSSGGDAARRRAVPARTADAPARARHRARAARRRGRARARQSA